MSAKQIQKSIELAGYFSGEFFITVKSEPKKKYKITPDQF